MGTFPLVLLLCAVALVVAAEWPRIDRALGSDARTRRLRARRKRELTLVRGDDEAESFAASVERDLASLPTTGEPDGRSRRRR